MHIWYDVKYRAEEINTSAGSEMDDKQSVKRDGGIQFHEYDRNIKTDILWK